MTLNGASMRHNDVYYDRNWVLLQDNTAKKEKKNEIS